MCVSMEDFGIFWPLTKLKIRQVMIFSLRLGMYYQYTCCTLSAPCSTRVNKSVNFFVLFVLWDLYGVGDLMGFVVYTTFIHVFHTYMYFSFLSTYMINPSRYKGQTLHLSQRGGGSRTPSLKVILGSVPTPHLFFPCRYIQDGGSNLYTRCVAKFGSMSKSVMSVMFAIYPTHPTWYKTTHPTMSIESPLVITSHDSQPGSKMDRVR